MGPRRSPPSFAVYVDERERNPTSENLDALADALDRRGGDVHELAQQLQQATEVEG